MTTREVSFVATLIWVAVAVPVMIFTPRLVSSEPYDLFSWEMLLQSVVFLVLFVGGSLVRDWSVRRTVDRRGAASRPDFKE